MTQARQVYHILTHDARIDEAVAPSEFVGLAAVALCVRGVGVYYAFRCKRQFGKGLRTGAWARLVVVVVRRTGAPAAGLRSVCASQ